MTKVLFIKANPKKTEQAFSLRLGQSFIDAYKAAHPDAEVQELDLYEDNIPLIDSDVMTGWGKLAQQEDLNNHEAHKVQRLGELVDQFLATDLIVFALPMWNLGYPPMLKAYLDAVSVAGKTFKYTAEGPVGLAGGKQVVLAEARGGVYPDEILHAQKHLVGLLAFLGITDVQTVVAEGMAYNPAEGENILAGAAQRAQTLAASFA